MIFELAEPINTETELVDEGIRRIVFDHETETLRVYQGDYLIGEELIWHIAEPLMTEVPTREGA